MANMQSVKDFITDPDTSLLELQELNNLLDTTIKEWGKPGQLHRII